MTKNYREKERKRIVKLIKDKNPVFYGDKAGNKFLRTERDFVLIDAYKNIYEPIRTEVIDYFKYNKVSWWGGRKPTGHVLSSQISCINHLYMIRNDKNAVLSILKEISPDLVDVNKIETDIFSPGYIQFEAISDNDNLNEGTPTRGSNCTSIDALICAVHKDSSNWLIPIEWKYTESYNNQNKAIEGCKKDPVNCKGEVRKRRYTDLINNSKQLKPNNHTCYYFEPFYQLMRQTLWAEQMIQNKNSETIEADHSLHVHAIPSENTDLLCKEYKCSDDSMENTWRNHLNDQTKYKIITPQELMSGILKENSYPELMDYLRVRYWGEISLPRRIKSSPFP